MPTNEAVWGLALGSGSARGWAPLGVIRALADLGIRPRVVAGSSVGAMVGAAWAARQLDVFERWTRSLTRRDVFGFVDISLGGSLVKGERLYAIFERYSGLRIETLPRTFAAVATDFGTGERVCFREGSVLDAVRASMAMPGLFPPVYLDGRWLIDGGLVDPIPVELCRRLGATHVIAVNLNRGIVEAKASRELAEPPPEAELTAVGTGGAAPPAAELAGAEEAGTDDSGPPKPAPEAGEISARDALVDAFAAMGDRLEELRQRLTSRAGAEEEEPSRAPGEPAPGLYDVLIGALHILQDRVARVTLEQHPPDLELCPQLGHIAMLEVYRAEEAIAEGRRVVLEAEERLRAAGRCPPPLAANGG
ncbi:MAG: patatin-like phospholipase family protein [Holophagales bacterium]|nr:patatin-like phospholipase family protein [Holophagales bacterium]